MSNKDPIAFDDGKHVYCMACDWKKPITSFEQAEFELQQHLSKKHKMNLTHAQNLKTGEKINCQDQKPKPKTIVFKEGDDVWFGIAFSASEKLFKFVAFERDRDVCLAKTQAEEPGCPVFCLHFSGNPDEVLKEAGLWLENECGLNEVNAKRALRVIQTGVMDIIMNSEANREAMRQYQSSENAHPSDHDPASDDTNCQGPDFDIHGSDPENESS